MLLLCFQVAIGLKVTVRKSEMVPIGRLILCMLWQRFLGCSVGTLLMSYLGMPLGASHKSPSIWNPGILSWRNLREDWRDGRSCICQKVVD